MPKGSKVARCVRHVQDDGKSKVSAIKICQTSTGDSYRTGKKSKNENTMNNIYERTFNLLEKDTHGQMGAGPTLSQAGKAQFRVARREGRPVSPAHTGVGRFRELPKPKMSTANKLDAVGLASMAIPAPGARPVGLGLRGAAAALRYGPKIVKGVRSLFRAKNVATAGALTGVGTGLSVGVDRANQAAKDAIDNYREGPKGGVVPTADLPRAGDLPRTGTGDGTTTGDLTRTGTDTGTDTRTDTRTDTATPPEEAGEGDKNRRRRRRGGDDDKKKEDDDTEETGGRGGQQIMPKHFRKRPSGGGDDDPKLPLQKRGAR